MQDHSGRLAGEETTRAELQEQFQQSCEARVIHGHGMVQVLDHCKGMTGDRTDEKFKVELTGPLHYRPGSIRDVEMISTAWGCSLITTRIF